MKKLLAALSFFTVLISPASENLTVWKSSGNIRIVSANHPTAATVQFPAIPRKEKMRVILSFDSWLGMENCIGWNHYLQLRLNQNRIRENMFSGEKRLLRRGSEMQTTIGSEPWWKGDLLQVFFGPGPSGNFDKRVKNAQKERYRFSLDITDIINFIEIGADNRIESAQENTLHLTNNYLLRYIRRNGVSPQIDMFVGNMQIDLVPEKIVKSLRPAQDLFPYPAPGKQVFCFTLPNGKAAVCDGGDLMLYAGKAAFALQSDFSYPATPSMKYNTFSTRKSSSVKKWRPAFSVNNNIVTVNASSAQYTISRKIFCWKQGLRIEDTIRNTSVEDIAVAVRYSLIADKLLSSRKYFLAGNTDVDIRDGIGAHPTILAIHENASAGMMVCDAVFRNQTLAQHVGNAVNFFNTHLGIPSGKSYTIVRLVHLVDSPDQFSYLNLLRRELNRNNVTIPGPFKFGHRAWKEWPKTMRNAIVNGVPWIEYMNGSGKSRADIKIMAREELTAIHARDPKMKLLATLEHNLVAVDTSRIPGGNILPARKPGDARRYGIKLNSAQSRLLESNPHSDSMIRDHKGNIVVENTFAKAPYIDLFVYSEIGNYRYKHIMQLMDFLMDECFYNGIYMDQFAAGGAAWNRVDRMSFDKWDGFSVNMTPDGKIKEKCYDYIVTGASARVNITKHVLDKGGIFIANTQPCTEEENLVPGIRFTEMENNNVTDTLKSKDEPADFHYQALGQLSSTPVTLGIRPHIHSADRKEWGKLTNRAIIIALRHGLVYYNYHVGVDERYSGYGILDKMFPITPVELGKGFIIGKERILTAVSRQFVISAPPKAVYAYNENGMPKKSDHTVVPDGKGKFIISIKLKDWNETCAVIL